MSTPPDLLIRTRRAAFNRAIAEGDASAIGPILARDCVMVTGTDSAVIAGRAAQVTLWQREFAASRSGTRDRLVYVRTPASITLSPVEPIALEQGAWQGHAQRDSARPGGAQPGGAQPGGAPLASGLYSAKWRALGDQWVIEAEIFVTLG